MVSSLVIIVAVIYKGVATELLYNIMILLLGIIVMGMLQGVIALIIMKGTCNAKRTKKSGAYFA